MSVPVSLRDELALDICGELLAKNQRRITLSESSDIAADAVLGSEALQSIRAMLCDFAIVESRKRGDISPSEVLHIEDLSPSVVAWVMGDTP